MTSEGARANLTRHDILKLTERGLRRHRLLRLVVSAVDSTLAEGPGGDWRTAVKSASDYYALHGTET